MRQGPCSGPGINIHPERSDHKWTMLSTCFYTWQYNRYWSPVTHCDWISPPLLIKTKLCCFTRLSLQIFLLLICLCVCLCICMIGIEQEYAKSQEGGGMNEWISYEERFYIFDKNANHYVLVSNIVVYCGVWCTQIKAWEFKTLFRFIMKLYPLYIHSLISWIL